MRATVSTAWPIIGALETPGLLDLSGRCGQSNERFFAPQINRSFNLSEKAKKPATKAAAKKAVEKVVAKKSTTKKASAVKPLASAAARLKEGFIASNAAVKPVAKKAAAKAVAKKAASKTVAKKAVAKKLATKKVAAKAAMRSGKKPSSSGLPARKESASERLRNAVLKALDDLKAKDVVVIDVRQRTSITDDLVFATGTSSRHVKSIADEVVKAAKAINMPPIGVEGEREGEWVLVDLADVVVHVMLPATREFYGLERLWSSAAESVNS